MKTFVTGASGFIGSTLCRLLSDGMPPGDITCLIRDPDAAARFRDTGYTVIQADLLEIDAYRDALKAAERVFHLGALATFGNNLDYDSQNIVATRLIVDELNHSTALKKFIFTSTIGAVDRTPQDPCTDPLTADSTPCPQSDYGKSKLACEALIRNSALPWIIVRPSWVYGPAMRPESHIAAFARSAMDRKPVTRLHFTGRVSVIYIDDMAAALVHLAGTDAVRRTLFAAAGQPRALGEIFEQCHAHHGHDVHTLRFPGWVGAIFRSLRRFLPLTVQCLFSDVLMCTADELRTLGFEPRTAFDEGMQKTVTYVRSLSTGIYIITGAAGGIGEAFARRLAADGRQLLLVDKDEEALLTLAQELGVEHLACDLSDPASPGAVRAHVDRLDQPVYGLINNAGFGIRGKVTTNAPEDLQALLQVNTGAMIALCRLFLPDMLKRGSGKIINVSSSIAFVSLPYMAVYGASKAAVLSFSEALWSETRGSGVDVTCVCPAGTMTNFQKTARVKVLNAGRGLLSPGDVAATALRASQKRRMTCMVGISSRPLLWISHWLPRKWRVLLWERLMSSMR
jgi:short-subunit dehydrogenase/thioester reductase-like protein